MDVINSAEYEEDDRPSAPGVCRLLHRSSRLQVNDIKVNKIVLTPTERIPSHLTVDLKK